MRALYIYILLFCLAFTAQAQDLNVRVSVLSPRIQSTNKRIFQTLQTAMRDFLNGRKWVSDPIASQERIECSFILNVTSWEGGRNFSG